MSHVVPASSTQPSTAPTTLVVTVTRHQCPHCRRTWAKRAAAERHVARCWRNPENRSCKTCAHLMPAEEGPYPEHPGWPEECSKGRELPDESGVPLTGCSLWGPTA